MAPREPSEPDTYDWNLAPAHLKTRRQLRAAGLRPNGQEPTALMVREPSGRRKRLWAYLFDTTKAAPKRTATPAQLEAVAKAVRERQARAAERRGVSREELTRPSDPGPQWHTPAPPATTHKENTAMPETSDLMTSVMQHTGDDAQAKEQMQLGVPSGHGQRQFFLLATAAVNQARIQRARLDADYARAEQKGADARNALDQWVAGAAQAAEARLQ
ncbi:hypothetical protein IU421_29895, partial [Nocardia cyriacigeorgica]|uniref:RRQRL motif-containing zinc-binding protein n=1 Tax=Nocardia cyriacigeorgica TaxID=135487 RepID=UPI001E10C5CE